MFSLTASFPALSLHWVALGAGVLRGGARGARVPPSGPTGKRRREARADELDLLEVLVQRLHEHHAVRARVGIRAKGTRDILDRADQGRLGVLGDELSKLSPRSLRA